MSFLYSEKHICNWFQSIAYKRSRVSCLSDWRSLFHTLILRNWKRYHITNSLRLSKIEPFRFRISASKASSRASKTARSSLDKRRKKKKKERKTVLSGQFSRANLVSQVIHWQDKRKKPNSLLHLIVGPRAKNCVTCDFFHRSSKRAWGLRRVECARSRPFTRKSHSWFLRGKLWKTAPSAGISRIEIHCGFVASSLFHECRNSRKSHQNGGSNFLISFSMSNE